MRKPAPIKANHITLADGFAAWFACLDHVCDCDAHPFALWQYPNGANERFSFTINCPCGSALKRALFYFCRIPAKMFGVKFSAVIITFNEERNIAEAIRSVAWADEILVVDSESTDRTREIAESLGARVIVNPWPGFAAQKQFATDSSENDWILSLDADERVTDDLGNEIAALRNDPPAYGGYTVPRRSIYMG